MYTRHQPNEWKDAIMATKLSQEELLAQFENLTLIELAEFVKAFEEKFDVTAAAAVAVAAGPAQGGGAAPSSTDSTEE